MRLVYIFIFLICLFSSTFAQDKAVKIDEFENIPCDEYLMRIDVTTTHAVNNPDSTVYVLIYEGKERRYNSCIKKTELMFPTRGSARAKIHSIKKYLSYRKFPIKRFSFIEAGFRERITVEIWLVPNGEKSPKPTPTLKEMKYRKGKAIGFCIDCCGI